MASKKLISTHYDAKERTYKLEYTGGNDNDIEAGTKTPLMQNGDFRSDECIELLKEADICVTNPPFSLFRSFISLLMEHNKKFIVIGSKNAITYKEIFPLIRDNKMWIGAKSMGGSLWFRTPDGFENKSDKIVDGVKLTEVPCCWFTNLDIAKRHEEIVLWKKYSAAEYPEYDNYKAISVNKTEQIPVDYNGLMGVPITFLDKYNPDEFEIFSCSAYSDPDCYGCGSLHVNKKKVFARIIIRKKAKTTK